jgi:hypothetical protein
MRLGPQDVDARDKRGHDAAETVARRTFQQPSRHPEVRAIGSAQSAALCQGLTDGSVANIAITR